MGETNQIYSTDIYIPKKYSWQVGIFLKKNLYLLNPHSTTIYQTLFTASFFQFVFPFTRLLRASLF